MVCGTCLLGLREESCAALQDRVELHRLQDRFGEILVPTEEVVEMRGGQKRTSERMFFPGYVLVQMELDDDTWHLVKETPRVMGFIGGKADKPAPITDKEAELILQRVQDSEKRHGPRHCLSPAKWFVLSMVRLMTLTESLKKLITKRAACVCCIDLWSIYAG